jgi:hypothetical protein
VEWLMRQGLVILIIHIILCFSCCMRWRYYFSPVTVPLFFLPCMLSSNRNSPCGALFLSSMSATAFRFLLMALF